MEKERAVRVIEKLEEEYPDASYYLNYSNNFELLIAAILSAQTRDEVVNETTEELFKKYKKPGDFLEADLDEVVDDISSISYAGNKAKWIKKTCQKLVEKHDGEVPDELGQLTDLTGVGRKTANTILINGFDKVVGIPVDTHVQRLSYRLGWTDSKDPDDIEEDLKELIPEKYWKKLPYILKDHGRAVCKSPVPVCSECVVNKLCPKKDVDKKK